MNSESTSVITNMLSPLSPIPTGISPFWHLNSPIRAVLFDIYGTLLISGTGDIGVASTQRDTFGMGAIFSASGFTTAYDEIGDTVPDLLEQWITARHTELRSEGIDYPEVDIRAVWSHVLQDLWDRGLLVTDPSNRETEMLALRHELAVNPVWAMPGFPDIVEEITSRGLLAGIVSNAQFYTPLILEALAGKALDEIGFHPDLKTWSYEISRAKPSVEIFTEPLERLTHEGISPEEVLYVGNDMLNDITAASRAGCRTALFAGDSRSLRMREGDERIKGVEPDIILTDLDQLKNLTLQGARYAEG
ncbi:MAG: HAD family hydrolase [Spirochaetaceae bacterium]|nr:HAD family hydrolase [Spirochaetaceae bacterium]MDT8296794.1 HAD family hydrolase [Spirochaetaceae bacterium]